MQRYLRPASQYIDCCPETPRCLRALSPSPSVVNTSLAATQNLPTSHHVLIGEQSGSVVSAGLVSPTFECPKWECSHCLVAPRPRPTLCRSCPATTSPPTR